MLDPDFKLPEAFSWVDLSNPEFNEALDLILNSNQNLVIIGPGGVGKSILLRLAAKMLSGNTVVLSSTGISAANLSGDGIVSSTIHSFFRLKPLPFYTRPAYNYEVMDIVMQTDTILIDEISMVDASLMENILKSLDAYSHHDRTPRVIMFGDVLQLPPVVSNNPDVVEHFKDFYGGRYMFFNSPRYQQTYFNVIHLNKIYRQSDASWQNILNRVRLGVPTKLDMDTINSRVTNERKFLDEHEYAMYLVPSNKRVNAVNSFYYDDMFDESRTYTAKIKGSFDLSQNPHLLPTVELAPGMQVMCTHNNHAMGYQNGTLGKVLSVTPESVEIKTEKGNVVEVVNEVWEQYEYVINPETKLMQPMVTGTFTQMGCKPAFACTVHKSQGLTLNALYGELAGFADGLIYVGLSRCKSLEGIGLKYPIKRRDIRASAEALEFLKKHESNDPLSMFF